MGGLPAGRAPAQGERAGGEHHKGFWAWHGAQRKLRTDGPQHHEQPFHRYSNSFETLMCYFPAVCETLVFLQGRVTEPGSQGFPEGFLV